MDAECFACKKTIVNWDVNDGIGGYIGPPTCLACLQKMELAMYPIVTLPELTVLWFLWPRSAHQRINTGGFDPYSGDRWTTKVGPLSLVTDTTITLHAEIEWRGKTLWECYAYDHRDHKFRRSLPMRAMFWLHSVLQEEHERSYVEDPYGCLADYE